MIEKFGGSFVLLRFVARVLGKEVATLIPTWLKITQKDQTLPPP